MLASGGAGIYNLGRGEGLSASVEGTRIFGAEIQTPNALALKEREWEGFPCSADRVWGSVVSSPSGVLGEAPAEIDFSAS